MANAGLTQADRVPLAQSVVRIVKRVFSDFPEMRLFPEPVYDVTAGLHILYWSEGWADAEIVELLESPKGTVAIAGTVYGLMNGHHVGADAAAIECGML